MIAPVLIKATFLNCCRLTRWPAYESGTLVPLPACASLACVLEQHSGTVARLSLLGPLGLSLLIGSCPPLNSECCSA